MKMYMICDNTDTHVGMRLAGVDGVIVHRQDELTEAINKALEDREIGILLINEGLVKLNAELIDSIKLKYSKPLIVEVPDRHGTGRAEDFITSYVNDAIGINI